ncbi:MAG: GerMN domain-containing protein [Patescibacteria group bacterium]
MTRPYVLLIILIFLIIALIFFILTVREAKAPLGQINSVQLFFGNSQLDPQALDCTKVFPVLRQVSIANKEQVALESLLIGPTEDEKEQGYFTSINQGVVIQNFIIEQGVARVDFNQQLEYQVGGSCRVTAIRAQITNTLKQFNQIKDVIISINGRTEDILQP